MGCSQNGYGRVNQFALVSYIPDPLGRYLDLLRLRLAPECRPHAHVTVLPPRPLRGTVESAESELRDATTRFHAFDVKLGNVELFEATEVIYIEVARGEGELVDMHRELNRGAVQFTEPFEFHPHITLAQNLPHDRVQEILLLARQLWSEWNGMVTFPVEELAFVQNTLESVWIDLLHLRLSHEPARSLV
jgi:2'-5' RNA ligase